MIKARITSLVLLLLYSTSCTETTNSYERQSEIIRHSISEIRDYFNAIKEVYITPQFSEERDIQIRHLYYYKIHSLKWLLRNLSRVLPKTNSMSIEPTFASSPSHQQEIIVEPYEWNPFSFSFVWSENNIAEQYIPVSESQSCKWWGYWDSRYTPKDTPVNLFRCYLNHDCKEGLERGNRLAILLNDFQPDDSESLIRQRLQNWNKYMSVEITEATEFIILEDEPRHKGFSVEQLESMVEIAKEEMGDFNFTFSFMRRASWENIMPENLDVVWINFYPFYRQDYYPEMFNGTQKEFNDVLISTVTKVRKKIPHVKIMLTGQAFYDDHYRKPPIESVQWYHEFIQKYDYMIGAVWYQWRDFKGTGTKSMLELYDNQKRIFEQICKS